MHVRFLSVAPNGKKVNFDVPNVIKTKEEFDSLVYGHHSSKYTRKELQGMPELLSLYGPMFNGFFKLPGTDEEIPVIRYETREEMLSND